MKLLSVIVKSSKEQIRNFWILILTIVMAPFFVFIYYLIAANYQPHYTIIVLNQDKGVILESAVYNYGDALVKTMQEGEKKAVTSFSPFTIVVMTDKDKAIKELQKKKANLLVTLPHNFSVSIQAYKTSTQLLPVPVELSGDLTDYRYMLPAIQADAILQEFIFAVCGITTPIALTETAIGSSGNKSEFDLAMPGLLILSTIMLMFTATIAIVEEVESKTILRLRFSRVSALEFLAGTTIVQVAVGLISVALTLVSAIALGFKINNALGLLILISSLNSISIMAFSLILAVITKTVNDVLIIGNFPLFFFMFFTGAAFPITGATLFTIGGYSVTLSGIMSSTHAISALNKVLTLNLGLKDILPEIIALIVLCVVYFVIGVFAFNRRYMRVR